MNQAEKLFGLNGKVVVVTGGTGLIGRELVKVLPRLGARLVVGARNVAGMNEAGPAETGDEAGIPPLFLPLDVADPESIKEFFARAVEQTGRMDALVNNFWPRTEKWGAIFEEVEPDSLYQSLHDHSGGFFLCCQTAAKYLKEAGGGAIVNMGSIYGSCAPHFDIYQGGQHPSPAEYPLVKGGIHTFTKYLATYLAKYNIRANCLLPGGVQEHGVHPAEFVARYSQQTPLGRMAEPGDMVGPLVFLISDASRYVTGELLAVDGGWLAW